MAKPDDFNGIPGCSWVTRNGNRVYGKIIRVNARTVTCEVVKSDEPNDGRNKFYTGNKYYVNYSILRPERTLPVQKQKGKPYPIGLTIADIRWATKEDLEQFGFDEGDAYPNPPQVLVLSDGTCLMPSRDPECNGTGFMLTTHGSGWLEVNKEGESV